jgi:hypothetical protein
MKNVTIFAAEFSYLRLINIEESGGALWFYVPAVMCGRVVRMKIEVI